VVATKAAEPEPPSPKGSAYSEERYAVPHPALGEEGAQSPASLKGSLRIEPPEPDAAELSGAASSDGSAPASAVPSTVSTQVSFYQHNSAKAGIPKVDPLDFENRKVCWIRDSFHIRDPDPLVRRGKRLDIANRPRSLSIKGEPSIDEDPNAELFQRASKTGPSYVGQMGTGSYFLSLAEDVNVATLKRLGPDYAFMKTAAPTMGVLQGDFNALVVLDWDDTLFPTTWSNRIFPASDTDYRACAKAAVALLRAARAVGDVAIVTLAREGWVDECLERVADAELSAEVENVRIMYARSVSDTVAVWARRNEPSHASHPLGVLLNSLHWETELRAQLVIAKMTAIRSAMKEGCRQVISIGDSDLERWAVHDLQFADDTLAGVLVKTIKFPEELCNDDLGEMLKTAEKLLDRFVRMNVEMDVDLRCGDTLFPKDLQFAMKTASLRKSDISEPSTPTSPGSGTPFAVQRVSSMSRLSLRKGESWTSHEL
jgi:hypothetical protein